MRLLIAVFCFFKIVVHGQASNDCQIQKQQNIAGAVFSGGENLSFKNCGHSTSLNKPWRVSVNNGDCEAILISHRTALVTFTLYDKCKLETYVGSTGPFGTLEAQLGTCIWEDAETCDDREDNNGLIMTVLEVRRLTVTKFDSVYMLIFETVPSEIRSEWVSPVCLFNMNNTIRENDVYHASTSDSSNLYEVDRSLCVPKYKCNKYRSLMCMKTDTEEVEDNVLLKMSIGLYFLRGLLLLNEQEQESPSYLPYLDIVHFIDLIAENAPDIHRLPKTPPFKEAVKFNNRENLSFGNCGRPQTEGQTRQRRSSDCKAENMNDVNLLVKKGQIANRLMHPWHADLKINSTSPNTYSCVGSLVTKRAVVTAAHCVYYGQTLDRVVPSELLVTLGRSNYDSADEQTLQAANIFIHEGYNHSSRNFKNDIAVVTFSEDFKLTRYVQPVCLWNKNNDINEVVNMDAVLAGFDLGDENTTPYTLHKTDLVIQSYESCYSYDPKFFGTYLKPGDHFCAGDEEGEAPCKGLSGGGLMIQRGSRWYLRGIAIFCKNIRISDQESGELKYVCDPTIPAVFTDAATYTGWIVEVLKVHTDY